MNVELSDDERTLLTRGLQDWTGPAHCTEALARAMGFADKSDLFAEGRRIAQAVRDNEPLSERDWTRALLSAELNFGSDILGTGTEWTMLHGGNEERWLCVLRDLSSKLPWSRKHLPA